MTTSTDGQQRLNYGTLFEPLANLMQTGVLILDRERVIQFANSHANRLLGCEEGKDLSTCWAPVRPHLEAALDKECEEAPHECETSFDYQGSHYHLLFEVRAIDRASCTGYLVLVKDKTQLEGMEEILRLATQFSNTGRLYHALAHNLRHPVTSILIRLDLLKNIIDGDNGTSQAPDAALQLRSLETIRSEVQELDHTLSMLLEELSPADVEEQAFDLREALTAVARLVEPQARQQNVALEVDLPASEVCTAGWPHRLKQAVMNLAVNALEAMPSGGRLALTLSAEEGQALVRVQDDGPGIAPEVRPRIFDLHFTTRDEGTGVGLHVVKEAVALHGGRVSVETEEGAGCTFCLHLPVERAEDATKQKAG